MSKKAIKPQPKTAPKKPQQQQTTLTQKVENFLNNKFVIIGLLAVISLVFYSNYSAIFDKKIDLNGDNIIYFSCAKSIADGEGYTSPMGFEKTPQTHFPIGYPIFLAGLQKISPNDILFCKKANGVLLWLSLLLFFLLIKKITKNTPTAFFATLFCAIQYSLLQFSTIMMSEMLFIFISLTALHLALYLNEKIFLFCHCGFDPQSLSKSSDSDFRQNDKKQSGKWKNILLLILFLLNIAYIYLVRSWGISLILALGIWFGILALQTFLIFRKEKKSEISNISITKKMLFQRVILCFLTAFALLTTHTLWNIRQANCGKTESDYKSDFLKKKGGNGETMATWNDWKTRIEYNISGDITKWLPNVISGSPFNNGAKAVSGEWLRGILLLIVMIFGFCCLKRNAFWLIFSYLAIGMTVMIFYFEEYQGPRYLMPMIPFFIFLFFNGISNITGFVWQKLLKKENSFIPKIAVLAIFAIFLYPKHIKAQEDLRLSAKVPKWEYVNNPKMTNYLAACQFAKDSLPETIRMITRKPEIFYMFSGYKHSTSFPWVASPDSIISYLKTKKATHVILDDWYQHGYRTLFPAIQQYPEKFKILKQIGQADNQRMINPTYVFEFNDKWGYYGERKNGVKSGKGYEIFQDGRKYEGNFEDNLPNGYGILYLPNGQVAVKGQWKNGMMIKPE
ncbi:MAG: hypothetical protein LBN95_11930 [Prevotellaceae bacterium]|jgi:hypothetical protein|nr:hypothetical protein [Prevotellaceae bacterium]